MAQDRQRQVGDRPSVEQMQTDFRALQFGMFIHFNLATFENAQWVQGYHSPADFAPGVKTIDTDAWADAAKAAGMTYAVLTVKHVSGFCLWDSRYTTYDVMNPACPYQKDLVAQFVRSFTRRGLKVGFYYCWRNPGFGSPDKFKVLPPECDPATHSLPQQIAFQEKQIDELVDKYPQCFYIWNDGLDPRIMPAQRAKAFFRGLHRPVLASNNWWDWARKGTPFLDIAVKEMREFPSTNTYPGETCWKLDSGWFWHQGAGTAASARQIIPLIQNALAHHSNFLLDVGPDTHGRILPTSLAQLQKIGQWMRQRSETAPPQPSQQQ